ncbi:MAG: HTH domain-containing protein [Mesorhizobium sp.]|nr:HTH domain-containing protein [Mesorhizobium sp.]
MSRKPQLSPQFLCKQLDVSRRTLYRAFEECGGVHEHILGRRLAAVAARLISPNENRPLPNWRNFTILPRR